MPFYHRSGQIPHKRHTQFRSPSGELYHEELMGIHGFSGVQSLLYHLRPPTRIQTATVVVSTELEFEPPGPLKHRLLNTLNVSLGGNAVDGRKPLLGNQDCVISVAQPDEAMPYWYKFAHGDEVHFIHEGTGKLESQFGVLHYRPGDYLVIPTGVMWRIIPDPVPQRMLITEAFGHIAPPKRYINNYGQFLENSPYCERDIRMPETVDPIDEAGEFEVRVKARGVISAYTFHHHPMDVVGWDGHLWPYAFNIEDFEPITGRVHQPPPVHQTFDGPGFVVCSFVPRLFDYHPDSIPAPYNHSNVDSDEVLYYVAGDFMSRKDVDRASLTIHPNGIPHGPHPGTYEGSIGKEKTEELAVMIDTFRPLRMTKQALGFENPDYYKSWQV